MVKPFKSHKLGLKKSFLFIEVLMEFIIVIVGFLGAGKTTLLKKLTKEFLDQSWDPYIILNDYQNASMDSQQFLSF